jgi:hypothetical protein
VAHFKFLLDNSTDHQKGGLRGLENRHKIEATERSGYEQLFSDICHSEKPSDPPYGVEFEPSSSAVHDLYLTLPL